MVSGCPSVKGERSTHPPLLPMFANLPHPPALLVTLLIFTVRVNGEVGLSTGILTYSRPGALAPLGRLAPLVGVGALPFPCGRRVVLFPCCAVVSLIGVKGFRGSMPVATWWLKVSLIIQFSTSDNWIFRVFVEKLTGATTAHPPPLAYICQAW